MSTLSHTILIADDDLEMRRMLDAALRQRGYEILVVSCGEAAIETLTRGDGTPVELVVSDIKMPKTDGFQLLSWIREHSPHTPVVLITAFGDTRTHQRAAEIGAAAVFDKPFELQHFCDAIDELILRS